MPQEAPQAPADAAPSATLPDTAPAALTHPPAAWLAPERALPPELRQQQDAAAGALDTELQAIPAATPAVPAAARIHPAPATLLPAAQEPRTQPLPAWRAPSPPQPSADAAGKPPPPRRALAYVSLAIRGTALLAAGLIVGVLALAVLYRWVNPPVSTLMIGRSLAGTEIERTWKPLERISPHLMRAVILSEDTAFCRHRGVDWAAIEEAIETDRGGSTITMQVVKNLFLWPSRSYVRKAIEIGLAYLVESLWPKRRILEIYLNVAEWGDGVFGAEAASQVHFGKSAARLTADEAALLAAVLPNPIERTAGLPSELTGRLASRLATRMRTARADFSCVPVPRLEPGKAPQKEPARSPQRSQERPSDRYLERSPDRPPLVQGQRMAL